MTLDLGRVALEMERLRAEVRRAREARNRARRDAEAVMRTWAERLEDVQRIAREGSERYTSWMVAEPLEPLGTHRPPGRRLDAYTALATDGSHLDTERHHYVRCYLLNIGRARLTYGPQAGAALDAQVRLHVPLTSPGAAEDEAPEADVDGTEDPVVGTLVGPSRAVLECAALAELAAAAPPGLPTAGLLDATLVLWGLGQEGVGEEARRELVDRRLFTAFRALLDRAAEHDFAFGSYVSKPGSREVVHTLVLLAEQSRPEGGAGLAALTDRDVMAGLLAEGERSALFVRHSQSTTSVEQTRYNQQGFRIAFFYVNVGPEIARVETLCRLVAEDGTLRHDRIDLLHAAVLDQCRRGGGYPAALIEADRQAVITAQDRRAFELLLQRVVEEEGEVMEPSGKSASKVRPNA